MNSIILSMGTHRGLLVDLRKRKFVSKPLNELSRILQKECIPVEPIERVIQRKRTVINSITYEVDESTSIESISLIAKLVDLLHIPYATVMVNGQTPSLEKIIKEVGNLNHVLIEVIISREHKSKGRDLTIGTSKLNIFNLEIDKILEARDKGIQKYSAFLESVSLDQLRIEPKKLTSGVNFDPDQGHLHLKITNEISASFGPFGSPHKNDWVKLSMSDQIVAKEKIDTLFRKTQNPLYFCHRCELRPLCTNSFVNRKGDLPSEFEPINCSYNLETGKFT